MFCIGAQCGSKFAVWVGGGESNITWPRDSRSEFVSLDNTFLTKKEFQSHFLDNIQQKILLNI